MMGEWLPASLSGGIVLISTCMCSPPELQGMNADTVPSA
jgi:hypothetical protein